MGGEGPRETVFFGQDGILEFENVVERVLAKEGPRRIDLTAVFILLAPESGGAVVLEGEAERIDAGVASGAFRIASMRFEALAQGEVWVARGIVCLRQGRYVGGRWLGRIVENDRSDPGPAGNGLSTGGFGGHGHDRSSGDDAALSAILEGDALEGDCGWRLALRQGTVSVPGFEHFAAIAEVEVDELQDGSIFDEDGFE